MKFNYEVNMLNNFSDDEKVYLEPVRKQVVVLSDQEAEKSNGLIILPYRDELCTHSEAISSYLREYNISIPKKVTVMGYLERIGRKYDFYDFWEDIIKERFEEWLEDIGISVAEINFCIGN